MYDFCIDTVGDGDENKKKKATGNNSVQFSDVAKVKQISDSKKLS